MMNRPAVIGMRMRVGRGVGRAWMEYARCRDAELDINPELFFPVGHGPKVDLQIEEAKIECRQCPVRAQCLQWALEEPHVMDGIWGGTTQEERAVMIRRARHINERES